MKKRPEINKKAIQLAKKTGWRPAGIETIIATIREIRMDFRTRGIPDYCRNVAAVLNKRKILRGWYRDGTRMWTRFDVRDAWFRHYGKEWSVWTGVQTPSSKPAKRSPRKPQRRTPRKAQPKLSWYSTPNYSSRQAREFCDKNKKWRVVPSQEFLDFVEAAARRGQTTEQIAARLTAAKYLRPNWTQSMVSATFQAMNNGVGLRDLLNQPSKKQMALPIKTSEKCEDTRTRQFTAVGKPEVLDFDPITNKLKYRETQIVTAEVEVGTEAYEELRRRLQS